MHIQPLDRRVLLAMNAVVTSTGTLNVAGSSAGESIVVARVADSIRVTSGAEAVDFPAADVRRLRVDAGGGADRIENQTELRATLSGDAGDDTLLGGTGDDSLFGGAGVDEVSYESRTRGVGLDIGTLPESSPIGDELISGAHFGNAAETDAISGDIEIFRGTAFADYFYMGGGLGSSTSQAVFASGGDDYFNTQLDASGTLYGERGNDTFYLEESTDITNALGGAGNDSFEFINANSPTIEDGGPGLDTAFVGINHFDGPLDFRQTQSIESVMGAGNADATTIYGPNNACRIDASGGSPVTLVAGPGNDTVIGGPYNDKLYGNGGNDLITGGEGNDRIFAGAGNDSLLGGAGKDTLHGEDGDDTLLGGLGSDTLFGDAGNDLASYEDQLRPVSFDIRNAPPSNVPDDGRPLVTADFGKNDEFDVIGTDAIQGSFYDDYFKIGGQEGNGINFDLFGSGGDDTFFVAYNGGARLFGDGGNDDFTFDEATYATAFGGKGDDTFIFIDTKKPSTQDGGPGNDTADLLSTLNEDNQPVDFRSTTSIESIINFGTTSGQYIIGPNTPCKIVANEETVNRVTIVGGSANDTLIGGRADDKLFGLGDNDLLIGGDGNDSLVGGAGDDILSGNRGRDTLRGEAGDDLLASKPGGIERLYGGDGTDTAIADGDDVLTDIESPGQI